VVGQCQCKANVIGLKCNQCEEGFFALSASNRQGCSPCNCNTDGTVSASDACHATTGQCSCKANVMGLKCDQCVNGTTRLSALNVDGCSFCECDSIGSLSTVCDTVAGACECKPGVGGNNCEECLDGYFGFSDEGCQPCMCNERGSTSTLCDKETGACVCRPNVERRVCDTCSGGYYNLSAGCVDCGCNTDGTVDGNATCLQDSGQCPCKENVEGRTCGTCSSGFTALSGGNPAGCEACNCSELGTDLSGSICDPLSSQCECLPSATGHRCDSCVSGFRITQEGCVECDCNPNGSSSSVCDIGSGECPCNQGVGGERCDFCISGFFNFPR
jgi:usherin